MFPFFSSVLLIFLHHAPFCIICHLPSQLFRASIACFFFTSSHFSVVLGSLFFLPLFLSASSALCSVPPLAVGFVFQPFLMIVRVCVTVTCEDGQASTKGYFAHQYIFRLASEVRPHLDSFAHVKPSSTLFCKRRPVCLQCHLTRRRHGRLSLMQNWFPWHSMANRATHTESEHCVSAKGVNNIVSSLENPQ